MSRINSNAAKCATLFFGCVIFHLAGTWTLPLIDRDEPRFAEASREMIERGDYVVPFFNNQFRFDKPPFAYWAQIVSYRVFGENDFAARFPSVIAAALVALSIFVWGSRLGGDKLGTWAAIIFTVALQTFLHAKAAVADMWLVLFMTLAYWAGSELISGGTRAVVSPTSDLGGDGARPSSWWWMFYLALAFAFLAKGPIGWMPLVTIPLFKFLERETSTKPFHFVPGILLTLAVVSLWGIPAMIRTHGEFFRVGIMHHVVDRSFNAMEGHGGNSLGLYFALLPFYFVTIFAGFFPWSIKLPRLTRRLCGQRDKTDNYLIAGVLPVFVIFTLVKTKLPHYTLPALPLLALLLARMLIAESANRFFRLSAITSAAVFFLVALAVPPFIARSFPAYALFRDSRDALKPEMEFATVDYTEPSLVWYFRSRVHGFMTPMKKNGLTGFMSKPGPRFVVAPTPDTNSAFPDHPAEWKTFSTHAFNVAKWRQVDLTLVIKPQ